MSNNVGLDFSKFTATKKYISLDQNCQRTDLHTSANMNVKVWMLSGQPTKRQMKNSPLQQKTRVLSNPITLA